MAHPCLANIFTVGLAPKGMSVKLREEQDDQALCGAVTRHHSSGAHVHTARASEQLAVLDFVLPQVLGGGCLNQGRLVSTRRELPIWKFSLPMK